MFFIETKNIPQLLESNLIVKSQDEAVLQWKDEDYVSILEYKIPVISITNEDIEIVKKILNITMARKAAYILRFP